MDNPQPPESGKLPRILGFWMATAIVIGTVIGSGVFKKPHAVAKEMSTFSDEAKTVIETQSDFGVIIVAWIVVGILSFMGSLILAEIATVHPRAGGNYVFLREGYGRWAGFLWGWVEFWIIRSGSIAALASIFTEALHGILQFAINDAGDNTAVLGFWARQGMTVIVIAVLAFVNARGTVLGGGLQVVVTTVKVVSLLSIALLPFIFLAFMNAPQGAEGPRPVDTQRLEPIWPTDPFAFNWSMFGSALVGILWAYHGWMNLAPVAEEVKNPGRNLPLAFLVGTLAVIVLYVSVNVAYHLVVSRTEMVLEGGTTPVATIFSQRLFGRIGLLLASLALMISVFGSLNGNLLVGPRLLFAMGQDGLAPAALSKLHSRWGTPVMATVVLAGWCILLVLNAGLLTYFNVMRKALFDVLTDYTMFGAVAFETLAVATIFVVRRQYPVDKVQLPYRCWGYPVIPIIYVVAMAAVLFNMFYTQTVEALIAVGFIGVGALVYFIAFGGQRPRRISTTPPPDDLPSNDLSPDAVREGEPPVRVGAS
jgi:amino acid transporter